MKRIILLTMCVFSSLSLVNADENEEYKEFLEYKKFKEQQNKYKKNAKDSTKKDSSKIEDNASSVDSNKKADSAILKKALESSDIAKLKSGGFIGVSVGGGLVNSASASCSGSCRNVNANISGAVSASLYSAHFDIGILGGYTHFFNPYFGLRGYGSFDYGMGVGSDSRSISSTTARSSSIDISSNFMLIGFGGDMLAEFAFGKNKAYSFGAILGLGGGYMIYKDDFYFNKINKFGLIINAGLSFGFLHKHRIELMAKFIPFTTSDFSNYTNQFALQGMGTYSYSHYQAKVLGVISYIYTF